MGRLVAEHFNQRGRPKRSFKTQQAAHEYLLREDLIGLYGYYQCGVCTHWHLTSRKYKSKKDLPKKYPPNLRREA
jgi:hypothetical protein